MTATADIGLLLLVGRILLDHDQRILFDRVVRSVIEDNLRHALGAGLDDVAFFQWDAVVGIDPRIAVALPHPDRAIERREVRLLRDRGRSAFERRRQTRNFFQQAGRQTPSSFHG